jgi:hypothetical protein
MKIIFDENVPWPLSRHFSPHFVTSVQKEGWSGIQNGELVVKVDGVFDVLLLADKNLRYQQNLVGREIAIVELPTNRWPVLQDQLAEILAKVEAAKQGSYSIVEG